MYTELSCILLRQRHIFKSSFKPGELVTHRGLINLGYFQVAPCFSPFSRFLTLHIQLVVISLERVTTVAEVRTGWLPFIIFVWTYIQVW